MAVSVLVVAEVSRQRAALLDALLAAGLDVRVAGSGEEALLACAAGPVGLVVLDVADGLRVLERLRVAHGERPRVLVVTSGPAEQREVALVAGADDCVSRPYSVGEVAGRVQAILRRSSSAPPAASTFQVGGLRLDVEQRRASFLGRPLGLTGVEFALLLDLASHAGIARSREQLVEAVWAPRSVGVQTVTVHLGRVRGKLTRAGGPAELVRSIWGVGYRLDAPEAPGVVGDRLRVITGGSAAAPLVSSVSADSIETKVDGSAGAL